MSEHGNLCDTTLTERLDLTCTCATYPGNLGPCELFEPGGNGRCAYCDHGPECHPAVAAMQESYDG